MAFIKPTEYRLYSSLEAVGRHGKRARIDLGALKENFRKLSEHTRTRAPKVRPIAVVKADAYGHGAPACTEALLACGCDFFAVSCIEEAVAVRATCRERGIDADVLILGYTDPGEAERLADENLIQTLVSPTYAKTLEKAAKNAHVCVKAHIAIDTGMNRIGFCAHNEAEIAQAAQDVADVIRSPHLSVCGMFTHFATADGTNDADTALLHTQAARYRALKHALEADGITIPFHHVCNSAAAMAAADTGEPPLFDGVRFGITLYGAAPHLHGTLSLSPVMRLEADIIHIHPCLKGERVSYGGTYLADRDRTVAVLPIGYADGWLRAYSGAFVTVLTKSGKRTAPIIGRICMDQTLIDVTGLDVCEGDTAVLFGETAEQLAALAARAKTIDYEILTLLSARVWRTYENS